MSVKLSPKEWQVIEKAKFSHDSLGEFPAIKLTFETVGDMLSALSLLRDKCGVCDFESNGLKSFSVSDPALMELIKHNISPQRVVALFSPNRAQLEERLV